MKKILLPLGVFLCLCACQKEAPRPVDVSRQPVPVPTQTGPAACSGQYAEKLRACEAFTCVESIDVNGPKTLTRTIVGKEDGLCVETTAWQAAANAAREADSSAPSAWPAQWKQTCRFPAAEQKQQADYLARYFSPDKRITLQNQLLLPPAEPGTEENPLAIFLQKQICARPALPGEITVPPVRCTGTESITVILSEENGVQTTQTVLCEN